MTATVPRLRAHGLVKRFGGLLAVDHVDLEVEPNEIVSVIGPNGSGKTTTFNLISGVLRPDEGSIEIDGEPIAGLRPDQISRRGVARTFQSPELFGDLSVREHVLIGLQRLMRAGLAAVILRLPSARREEDWAQARAVDVVGALGSRLTEDRLDDPGSSLSYANRRRLEIARAMAAQPRLILMDEPAAGMNPFETREIAEVIGELRAAGHSILLIEHDIELVLSISDRVVALDHGAKIAEGRPRAVVTDPGVVEAYLGA